MHEVFERLQTLRVRHIEAAVLRAHPGLLLRSHSPSVHDPHHALAGRVKRLNVDLNIPQGRYRADFILIRIFAVAQYMEQRC